MVAIRKAGGEIVELTPDEHKAFVSAVSPIYAEPGELGRDLLKPRQIFDLSIF